MANIKENFIIRFVYQFSGSDIITEVAKWLESTEECINFIKGFSREHSKTTSMHRCCV